MTSVGMSAVLVVLSLAVLVFLVMKGVNLIAAGLAAAAILAFGVEGGWINAIFTTFSSSTGAYMGNLVVAFMSGGVFGSIVIASGSDVVIGRTLINKFGTKFAVISLAVFVAIMGAVGINSWPFLAAIFAFSLMRACDLPLQVACVTMVGINSAFGMIMPGMPTMPNIVAAQGYGGTIYDGAFIGVVMVIVQCGLVLLYVFKSLIPGYRKKGMGYVASPMEASLRGEGNQVDESTLPSFAVAITPMAAVVILCMVFQFGVGLDSTASTVFAQIISAVLCIILNAKSGVTKKLAGAVTNGVIQTSWPLIATCCMVGYASLISLTSIYNAIIGAVSQMNISPYLLVVVATAIFAGIGADPFSGIMMTVNTVAKTAVAAGANPALLQRLTLAASTTLDSMPHSGNLNVTMGFLGLSHKDVYKQIVVVQIGATGAATIVGMIISMIIG